MSTKPDLTQTIGEHVHHREHCLQLLKILGISPETTLEMWYRKGKVGICTTCTLCRVSSCYPGCIYRKTNPVEPPPKLKKYPITIRLDQQVGVLMVSSWREAWKKAKKRAKDEGWSLSDLSLISPENSQIPKRDKEEPE